MFSTPSTSPQHHQEATRYAEHSSQLMASPEQRRTPTDPSAASISAVPPPPIAQTLSEGPVTYGQQTFHHLPPHIAAMVHNLPPISTNPSTISTSAAPSPAIAQAPSRGPITFGGQTFHHLPPGLAAQMAAISSAPRRGRPSTLAPPAVSLISLLIYKSNI
jgi:hypothetical protein